MLACFGCLIGIAVGAVPSPAPHQQVPAIPTMMERRLPNGLLALVYPKPSRGLAAVDVWIRAGSGHEQDGERGAAHFLEHLLFKGTSRREPGAVDVEMERLGGLLNAGTMRDAAHLFAVVPTERLAEALDIMQDALFGSVLAEDQVELERRVILDELARADDDAMQALTDTAFGLAWAGDPYAEPVLSRAQNIGAVTHDQIRAFYARNYRPERMAVVVVGDVDADAVLRAIERTFGDLRTSDGPARHAQATEGTAPSGPDRLAMPVRIPQRAPRPSLALWSWAARWGTPPEKPRSSDAAGEPARLGVVAELTAEILRDAVMRSPGAGSVQSDTVTLERGATISLWTEMPEADIGSVRTAVDAVVRRLARDGPSSFELEGAARRLLGRRLYRIETVLGLAREIGRFWVLGNARGALSYPEALKAVTADDVKSFVQRHVLAGSAGSGRRSVAGE